MRSRIAAAIALAAVFVHAQQPLTARQVIERIQKNVGVTWQTPTVDTFKAGDPETRVTGIATAFTDSYDVLQRAASSGKNLIISHEPSFYNHLDETKALENDAVYRQKIEFIRRHNMVVFRFHDHWHMRRPDGIMVGMVRELGWERQQSQTDPALFAAPQPTLGALAASIRDRLHDKTLRVVGDPGEKLAHIAMLPGAAGADRQIAMLERSDVDALVVGEAREWETVEYARDALNEGRHKGLIIIGHVLSEEAGMDECARWLKTFITEVPVEFIPAGEPFWRPE
ncbi:MAG TPA: Nif3-like dinuclear metal center hexameric protein [Bryobacteraceae bacterium]|nr:Nif3-like dinuclear metal center hexameric protein [Bryobacteraceae bacterium]